MYNEWEKVLYELDNNLLVIHKLEVYLYVGLKKVTRTLSNTSIIKKQLNGFRD